MHTESTVSPIILILFIALFVGIAAYILCNSRKRKTASWHGMIIDKALNENIVKKNPGIIPLEVVQKVAVAPQPTAATQAAPQDAFPPQSPIDTL